MKLEDQIKVINNFHDGSIVQFSKTSNSVTLKIEIEYLAELINKKFNFFKCDLINCDEIYFKFWEEENIIYDLELMNEYELEILSAEDIENKIVVKCLTNVNNGGELYIKTENIKIYAQDEKEITHSTLAQLSQQYRGSNTGN